MKWLKNVKIQGKLNFGFLIVAGLTIVIGIISIIFMLSMKTEVNSSKVSIGIIVVGVMSVADLVIAIILSRYISNQIAKPIKKNELISERFGIGNLDVSDIVTEEDLQNLYRKDEIGTFSLAFSKCINNIIEMIQVIKKVSDGDLSMEIPIRCKEDQLGHGLADLVDNFHQLVTTITTAIDQVASGANLVSDSSLALSQGATHQASSVQELTASLEQISSQTHLNAQNADTANNLAKSAKANAADGNAQMKDMLKAMDDISISSSNINKIIKVIDDIAFQTNILALNAAVEAARAGQHGKGFAVVAEEVRNLAGKSANAAKETTEMIENSIAKVEVGTKIANQTAKSLTQIVTEIDHAADLISSIAIASIEQAQGIEQINLGIAQVSQVIQVNAATAGESAAASEELSSQAVQLKENVSMFKLKSHVASRYSSNPQKVAAKLPQSSSSGAVKAKISLGDDDFGKY